MPGADRRLAASSVTVPVVKADGGEIRRELERMNVKPGPAAIASATPCQRGNS